MTGLGAIAFDLDGTLADDLPLTFAAFRFACLPIVGRELSDAEIDRRFGPSQEGILRALVGDHWQECARRFHEYFAARFGDFVEPFVGVDDLLSEARRAGLRIAIVTGAGERSVAVTLDGLGLRRSVDRLFVGQPEGSRKGDQLREIMGEWRCRPAELAYVGDSPSDMVAARDASALPLGAAWAATADAEALRAAGAHQVFATPEALQGWLHMAVAEPGP